VKTFNRHARIAFSKASSPKENRVYSAAALPTWYINSKSDFAFSLNHSFNGGLTDLDVDG